MKVGLLGLSDLGLEYLRQLVKTSHEVVLVTNKSKPSLHISDQENEVIAICKQHHIPYLGHVDVHTPDMIKFAKKCHVCIIGGYDKILKPTFLEAPIRGTINTHFGLIPENRGCNPTMWAILYGDVAGYTTYVVNTNIDLGEIIERQSIPITDLDTAKDVYDKLTLIAKKRFDFLLDTLEDWSWNQSGNTTASSCYHRAGLPNDGWISWQWHPEFLSRFSRSLTFPPYKGPRTLIRQQKQEIEFFVDSYQHDSHNQKKLGEIIKLKGTHITVQAKNYRVYGHTTQRDASTLKPGLILESVVGNTHPILIDYSFTKLTQEFCDQI